MLTISNHEIQKLQNKINQYDYIPLIISDLIYENNIKDIRQFIDINDYIAEYDKLSVKSGFTLDLELRPGKQTYRLLLKVRELFSTLFLDCNPYSFIEIEESPEGIFQFAVFQLKFYNMIDSWQYVPKNFELILTIEDYKAYKGEGYLNRLIHKLPEQKLESIEITPKIELEEDNRYKVSLIAYCYYKGFYRIENYINLINNSFKSIHNFGI